MEEVDAGNGEQKVRVKYDSGGEEKTGPWLFTSNHRGADRTEDTWKKGQNVLMLSPHGDFGQGMVLPHSENDDHLRPDHAEKETSTYQYDNLRMTKAKDYHEVWIAEDDQQQQQQQPQQQDASSEPLAPDAPAPKPQQSNRRQQSPGKSTMKFRIMKDGGVYGRVGKDDDAMRFAAHKDGVKVSYGKNKNVIFVTKDGCFSTQAIQIAKCNIPDPKDE